MSEVLVKCDAVTEQKDFRCQIRLNYSDSEGKATEQSVLFGVGTSYKDYITICNKMFEVIAHTYGEGFEEATNSQKKSQVV